MKALYSQKNIMDFDFTTETCVYYIDALKCLHNDLGLDEHKCEHLRSKGLYKDDKLRVFNYKKPKQSHLKVDNDIRFLIGLFNHPAVPTWYKPAMKFERDALRAMIDRYGLRKTAYIIYVMTPVADREKYDFIPDISTPSKLLNKAQSFSLRYKQEQIGEKEKKKVMQRTKLLEIQLKSFEEKYGKIQ